jgi:hypothetical protein
MQASVTEPSAPFERGDQSEACLALAASSPLDTVQHCLVVVGRRKYGWAWVHGHDQRHRREPERI